MKRSNLVAVTAGIVLLVVVMVFSVSNPLAFINLPGLLIVIGGTLTAALVSYSYEEVKAAFLQARAATQPLELNMQKDAHRLVSFSRLWFRHQYKVIDAEIEKLDDKYMQRGLQMIRDQHSLDDIMSALNWKIAQMRAKESGSIKIFRAMASFAPAFGLVGSLIGLVNMLQGMEAGVFASVKEDMVIALVTTFYGLLLANLVFKPLVTRLEQHRHVKTVRLSMIAEGVAMIQQNKTPALVQDNLQAYLHKQDDEVMSEILHTIANKQVKPA